MKIGIIGYGCVGKSVHNMLSSHEVILRDPPKNLNSSVLKTEACFICVPTPSIRSGQTVGVLVSVLESLRTYKGLIIIKSTTTPKNLKMLLDLYSDLNIMHAPEFVSEFAPYVFQERHLMGVQNISQAHLYRKIFDLNGYGDKEVRTTDIITAAMVKYTHNVHGAVKVALFNEIFDMCEVEKINYREMIGAMLAMNDNVGKAYTTISADGYRGYAGTCFPKDILALSKDYPSKVLNGAIDANMNYRPTEMKQHGKI